MGTRKAWLLATALVSIVGLKIIRDLVVPPAFGGFGVQRLLGRVSSEPISSIDSTELRPVLVADAAGLASLRRTGTLPQPDPVLVQDAQLGRPVIEVPYRCAAEGYAAFGFDTLVASDWRRASHLVLEFAGGGLPQTLLVSIDQGGHSWRFSHHLALQTRDWSAIRIPLLGLLDQDLQPWPATPGAAELTLTVLPFSGYQAEEHDASFRLAGIYLAGAIDPAPPTVRPPPVSAAPRWLDAHPEPAAPQFRCGDEGAAIAVFVSGPEVDWQRSGECGLEASLPAETWAIVHVPLGALPSHGKLGSLRVAGVWPSQRRMRFSLRAGDREISRHHLWLERDGKEPVHGVVELDAAALLAERPDPGAELTLAVDLHPARDVAAKVASFSVDWVVWTGAP